MLNKALTTIFSEGMCWKTYVRDTHMMSSHDASYASSIVLYTDDAVYRLDYYYYHI